MHTGMVQSLLSYSGVEEEGKKKVKNQDVEKHSNVDKLMIC